MTRRIVIEIERVAPEPHAVTRFEPFYTATAKVVNNFPVEIGTDHQYGEAHANDPCVAAGDVLNNLKCVGNDFAPNAHFCHTSLSCWLSGRCEKQFGPTGTACCE